MQDFEVKERLREHLEYLCSFDKLSGEPEAYRAVEYILEVLEKSGISCHEEDFPAYLSNPATTGIRNWNRDESISGVPQTGLTVSSWTASSSEVQIWIHPAAPCCSSNFA